MAAQRPRGAQLDGKRYRKVEPFIVGGESELVTRRPGFDGFEAGCTRFPARGLLVRRLLCL
jgi:hypothetical protein